MEFLISHRFFLFSGAILAFIGVALGAFAAHVLRTKLNADQFSIFEVGVRYQLYHALALIGIAWAYYTFPSNWISTAGFFILAGTIIFSGSLYLLVFTGLRSWGAVTPIGGVMFLIGWLCLAVGAFKIS